MSKHFERVIAYRTTMLQFAYEQLRSLCNFVYIPQDGKGIDALRCDPNLTFEQVQGLAGAAYGIRRFIHKLCAVPRGLTAAEREQFHARLQSGATQMAFIAANGHSIEPSAQLATRLYVTALREWMRQRRSFKQGNKFWEQNAVSYLLICARTRWGRFRQIIRRRTFTRCVASSSALWRIHRARMSGARWS